MQGERGFIGAKGELGETGEPGQPGFPGRDGDKGEAGLPVCNIVNSVLKFKTWYLFTTIYLKICDVTSLR